MKEEWYNFQRRGRVKYFAGKKWREELAKLTLYFHFVFNIIGLKQQECSPNSNPVQIQQQRHLNSTLVPCIFAKIGNSFQSLNIFLLKNLYQSCFAGSHNIGVVSLLLNLNSQLLTEKAPRKCRIMELRNFSRFFRMHKKMEIPFSTSYNILAC